MQKVDALECDWCDKLTKISNKKLMRSAVELAEIWPFASEGNLFRSRKQFCNRECLLKYIDRNPSVGKFDA